MSVARRVAIAQLLLIWPAALFMGALVVRRLGPLYDEPARSAQRIVMWYAGRVWTLWVLLVALPLAVLASGCLALIRGSKDDVEPATRVVGAATLSAGIILAIVVLHMLAN